MGLLDFLRRPAPITGEADLVDFLDAETSFIVQKTTWEYSRARAGVQWQKLFREAAFKDAITTSCWRNYPLTLGLVGEMAAATLRGAGQLPAETAIEGVLRCALAALGRHPLPTGFAPEWRADSERAVTERLRRTLLAPPRAVKDMPLDGHRDFHRALPIHPDLTRDDKALLLNTLRIQLCRSHEAMLARLGGGDLARALAA